MLRTGRLLLVLAAAGAVLASRPGHGEAAGAAASPRLSPRGSVAPGVLLAQLALVPDITAITNAGDSRLFITRQRGEIDIWDGTQLLPTPFLDVSTLIICCGEQGLLSAAFHPHYAVNGFVFVDYTNLTGQTVIARYHVSLSDPNTADPFSGVILLTIDQPYTNHNGGQLQFGPDGDLYVGMGDGGSENDPQCLSQSTESLLGKVLRIDVDQSVNQPPYYGIPVNNPFVTTTGPPEAWALGLRNPWRFSFDRLTGDLYIGDVGQNNYEEVDYEPLVSGGGQNYGWKIMEGFHCNSAGAAGCVLPPPACGDPAYTLPIFEYAHDNGRCAITGGYVYRGAAIPDLKGSYVYGDFCTGEIWSAVPQSGTWSSTLLPITAPNLTTFGEDNRGELYVGTQGALYQVVPLPPQPPTIDQVAPATGSTRGGEHVLITGSNFSALTNVLFGIFPSPSVTVQSSTALVAVAPPRPAGTVDVSVANPGVPAAVKALAFTYFPIPRVPRFEPTPRVVTRP